MSAVVHAEFRAMGTRIRCIGPAGHRALDEAADAVRSTFEREERRCSRFRSDSELSLVNASAGSWTRVSGPFAELVGIALEGWGRTGGRFDPTLLRAMVALGYDRDFDEVLAGARVALHGGTPAGRGGDVLLEGDRLRLPEGVGLDLGGVAKGWTADRAADAALAAGLPWALVDAGGDLRLSGETPPGGLEIAVEDPEDTSTDIGRIVLLEGALATSSVTRRAWGPDRHHLLDPATGAPSVGPVLQATVWAPTCAEAEIASKDALLRGVDSLEHGPALLVLRDGRIVTNVDALETAA